MRSPISRILPRRSVADLTDLARRLAHKRDHFSRTTLLFSGKQIERASSSEINTYLPKPKYSS